jgi:hypothetical protein
MNGIGLLGIGKIDRADTKHFGRLLVRRRAGNHDHGGDAAEAGKRQAFDQFFVGNDLVSACRKLAVDALDPERMPECQGFASRSRQDQLSALAREPGGSMMN